MKMRLMSGQQQGVHARLICGEGIRAKSPGFVTLAGLSWLKAGVSCQNVAGNQRLID
jgi:hypothetical protein